jgi:hypothetical protein
MAERSAWSRSAADAADFADDHLEEKRRLAKNAASAGRLRRAQTFLRTLRIEEPMRPASGSWAATF